MKVVEREITFGARIRALRLEAKLSQRDLADRLAKRLKGFDFTYLSKIENDRLVPSASAILALAAELRGSSDELLALAGKAPADVYISARPNHCVHRSIGAIRQPKPIRPPLIARPSRPHRPKRRPPIRRRPHPKGPGIE